MKVPPIMKSKVKWIIQETLCGVTAVFIWHAPTYDAYKIIGKDIAWGLLESRNNGLQQLWI